ncbi:MAG: ATP-binding protein [Clostridia bacterium]|nr:ATP-binding protein [Clostridia bacterium]
MAELKIPKRLSGAILNSLTGGVVPRAGLEYITVGRRQEIAALLGDIESIGEGGSSFRFISGRYGSGKSFLLQVIRNYAMEKGFVVADADLSPERRLTGSKGEGLATYKELMHSLSTKTQTEGGALQLIIEKWISGIQSDVLRDSPQDALFESRVERRILDAVEGMRGMVNGFDFARAVTTYWQAYRQGDDALKSAVLKWFRGEYPTKTDAKRELGVNVIVSDENWYDSLKLMAQFMLMAGYKGLLVILDELVNLYKLPNTVTRQYNYEKLLTMYNDTMQGRAHHIGIFAGVTPQCIEDTRRGLFSYEALKSRLEAGRFSTGFHDVLGPVIRLETLTNEEQLLLVEKLAAIHASHYGYAQRVTHDELIAFMKAELSRAGADTLITPREITRDFLEMLNILFQNPDKTLEGVLGGFKFTDDAGAEKVGEDFAEFKL